jgi:hypothetical protein
MLSTGTWTDDDRIEKFIDMVIERETWYAERVGRRPMTSRQEVLDYLATGKEINYDSDWYAKIRDADALVARPAPVIEYKRCDCGHTIPVAEVMTSSSGASCPDCYDRMSNP